MTKEFLRSELRNLLASIDKVGKYHNTFLDHVLETCINSVYYQVHAQNPKALGQYTWRYSQIITPGPHEGYLLVLPVELVPLPDKRGGARLIIDHTNPNVFFVPITDQEYQLMKSSQADDLTTTTPNVIYYVTEISQLTFVNMTATIAAHTITVDLIPAFTSIADTVEVRLPYGKNIEIMKMALEMIGVVPPKDLLDNNAER
jgi:hypothetical protein